MAFWVFAFVSYITTGNNALLLVLAFMLLCVCVLALLPLREEGRAILLIEGCMCVNVKGVHAHYLENLHVELTGCK